MPQDLQPRAGLELAFASRELRSICERQHVAVDKLGDDAARQLRARLADLRASASAMEIIAGRPAIAGDRLLFDLADGQKLVLVQNHPEGRHHNDGSVDWAHVTRLKITQIGSYSA